jgi:D-alanyl-D-alanine endopeptidase (penicillin-binding protein 7)
MGGGAVGAVLYLDIKANIDYLTTVRILSEKEKLNIKKPLDIKINAAAGGVFPFYGDDMFVLNPDKKWPIASITKLMTAVIVREQMNFNGIINLDIPPDDRKNPLSSGDYKAKDLLKAMLLISSNESANALADHYGRANFVYRMNERAKSIGMNDTAFVDPSGLSAENLSTVEDLKKLVKFIWRAYPELFEIGRKPSDTVYNLKSDQKKKLANINLFAGRADFLGGKTGQIPESGGNLISIFNINGPRIIIVLGTENRFNETEKILKQINGNRSN